jgi:hypothetical protein
MDFRFRIRDRFRVNSTLRPRAYEAAHRRSNTNSRGIAAVYRFLDLRHRNARGARSLSLHFQLE